MHNGRWRYWGPLGIVLGVAFGLRLWGIGQGLPYVYDVDEYGHFVPEAVRMFGHGLNPHYFVNPPALTYLLHVVFGVWFGVLRSSSHASIAREFALHPDRFFLLARVMVALLGTASVWLLYLLGARLFNRATGLLASAVMAVAFLPVFYGHLALNDVPTLVGLTLSLLGTAGVLRRGRMIDYLLAGVGLGLAAATKYTAGVMLLPLLGAAVAQYRDGAREHRRDGAIGMGLALLAALAAYLIANPYSLLDFHAFRAELELQSHYTEQSQSSWIGGPRQGSFVYYLWSFTWGLGWIPALAALGGAVTIWRRDRRICWALVPVAVLYLLFLSLQGRYFGRSLLPIFPVACLLAGASRWKGSAGRHGARGDCVPATHRGAPAEPPSPPWPSGCGRGRVDGAGARVQHPLRPAALAPRHAQPHACVDGRAHPRWREDRARAGRPERLAGRNRRRDRSPALDQVPGIAGGPEPRDRQARNGESDGRTGRLRAHAGPGAGLLLRADGDCG